MARCGLPCHYVTFVIRIAIPTALNIHMKYFEKVLGRNEEGGAMKCPKCGSEDVEVFTISNTLYCKCGKCGHTWKTDL